MICIRCQKKFVRSTGTREKMCNDCWQFKIKNKNGKNKKP